MDKRKRLSVGRVDTKNNTANLFTKFLDGPRTQSLPSLDYTSLEARTTESLTTALPFEQACEYPQHQQLTECTLRRN